jgi:hypothetical protein
MNNQDRIDAFCEKYPFEECDSEDYEKELTPQIQFTYPKKLRDSMSGETMYFEYDEENTYVETAGEYTNAGMFVHRGKRYSDIELYEYVIEFFKIQLG